MTSILFLPALLFTACFSEPSPSDEGEQSPPSFFKREAYSDKKPSPKLSGGLRRVADSLSRGTARIELESTGFNPPVHRIMATFWSADSQTGSLTRNDQPLITATCSSQTKGQGEFRVGALDNVPFTCACNLTVCPEDCVEPNGDALFIIQTLCQDPPIVATDDVNDQNALTSDARTRPH